MGAKMPTFELRPFTLPEAEWVAGWASTPDELRGRVSAVNMIFIVSSNQLSVLESGVVAALIGAPAAVVVGGSGVVLVAVAVAVFVPTLRAFRLGS